MRRRNDSALPVLPFLEPPPELYPELIERIHREAISWEQAKVLRSLPLLEPPSELYPQLLQRIKQELPLQQKTSPGLYAEDSKAHEAIPFGSHIVQLYNKQPEIIGVTAGMFRFGLSKVEKCLFAAAADVCSLVEQALKNLDIDVEMCKDSGQLIMLTEWESLLVNNRFDPFHLVSTHQTFVAQALREGYKAARIIMDMSWLTKDVATPEQILKYEAASDAIYTFQNTPIVALMHYDYAQLPGALVVELLKLHPIAVVGKFIKRNPHYLNSEQYLLKVLRSKRDKNRVSALLNG